MCLCIIHTLIMSTGELEFIPADFGWRILCTGCQPISGDKQPITLAFIPMNDSAVI